MMAVYEMASNCTIAALLQRITKGEKAASDELFGVVYGELHELAGWFIRRERPGHTLQPTALVNEVYLRMLGSINQDLASRSHFFATASAVMRRILVDYARSRGCLKRGSAALPFEVNDKLAISENDLDLILAVDHALTRLEIQDPRQARIVTMRFFGGLTEEEIALILNTSGRTVKRDWKVAKAWLRAEFSAAASAQGA